MVSLLIDTDVFRYSYTQLIHMYKQLYAIFYRVYAGGGCTIIFYTIVLTYEYMSDCSYISYMNICSCVHMFNHEKNA